jgi:hypothetical protein
MARRDKNSTRGATRTGAQGTSKNSSGEVLPFELLDAFFEKWPFVRGAGEQHLSDYAVDLEPALAMFLDRYGGSVVGKHPIFGRKPSDALEGYEPNTIAERLAWLVGDGWPIPGESVVFSDDGNGNPVYIRNGRVYVWDHDFGGESEIAKSFVDFVRSALPAT